MKRETKAAIIISSSVLVTIVLGISYLFLDTFFVIAEDVTEVVVNQTATEVMKEFVSTDEPKK